MRSWGTRALRLGKTVYSEFKANKVEFMAGSIAYRAFLSLVPLFVLLFVGVASVGDEAVAARVVRYTESFLPAHAQILLRNAIVGRIENRGTSVISVALLVWGSTGVFRGLDLAFSEIYGTDRNNSFLNQLVDGFVVFLALGLALAAAAIATTAFALLETVPFVGVLSPLVLMVGLAIAFLPMYSLFPDVRLSFREVVPGVAVAAVGWAILQALFQVYIAFAAASQSGEFVGGVLLLLTWLYFAGVVLLVGAVVNAVVGGEVASAHVETDAPRAEHRGEASAESES